MGATTSASSSSCLWACGWEAKQMSPVWVQKFMQGFEGIAFQWARSVMLVAHIYSGRQSQYSNQNWIMYKYYTCCGRQWKIVQVNEWMNEWMNEWVSEVTRKSKRTSVKSIAFCSEKLLFHIQFFLTIQRAVTRSNKNNTLQLLRQNSPLNY